MNSVPGYVCRRIFKKNFDENGKLPENPTTFAELLYFLLVQYQKTDPNDLIIPEKYAHLFVEEVVALANEGSSSCVSWVGDVDVQSDFYKRMELIENKIGFNCQGLYFSCVAGSSQPKLAVADEARSRISSEVAQVRLDTNESAMTYQLHKVNGQWRLNKISCAVRKLFVPESPTESDTESD